MGASAVQSIMSTTKTMMAIAEAMTFFYVVTGFATPVAHLAVVWTPRMNCMITNSDLGFASLSSGEVGSGLVIAVDASTEMVNCVGCS